MQRRYHSGMSVMYASACLIFLGVVSLCGAVDVAPFNHSPQGAVTGEVAQWHTITLGWDYEVLSFSESDATNNPFFNYRLDVTFAHNDESYVVPGYFAADGNAANTGATEGNVWLVHFVPSLTGSWTWQASFRQGVNISVSDDAATSGTPVAFDGTQGSFNVTTSNKVGRDLRSKGRLEYVGQSFLQFAGTGEYFFKSGVASPENVLAFADFDGSDAIKAWLPHQRDYRSSDPTWASSRGTGLIGALNYLSDVGINSISVQTLTLLGDDGTISPFVSGDTMLQYYDVSKLAQWHVVFDHANTVGLHIHVVTQEQENDQALNGGELGPERSVYYRELVARFSHHLALTWSLGEDNTNLDAQRKSYSDYIASIDPYQHPIVLQSFAIGKNATYTPLLSYPSISGISLQSRPESAYLEAVDWVQASTSAGRPWIVCNDEQNPSNVGVLPDVDDAENHASIRIPFLWGIIMAGGAGIEYYFGTATDESDVSCQDYRSRESMFNQSRYALEFLESTNVPSLHTLINANNAVDEVTWALSDASRSTFILYLPNGGSTLIDITSSAGSSFSISWYNPRVGGGFVSGSVTSIVAGSADRTSIGEPPYDATLDWVALVACETCDDTIASPVPSLAPMMAPFVPLSETVTPSVAPTGATPMMAPFVPLSATPADSVTAEGVSDIPSAIPTSTAQSMTPFISLSATPAASTVESVAPTSATPMVAPFFPLSPSPVSPVDSAMASSRMAPFIPLSPSSEGPEGTTHLSLSTASPTSATPVMAPFIPLSPKPVAVAQEFAHRGTISPTSASPMMAPYTPLTGTPVIAPSKDIVLSQPVHPQWKLTPVPPIASSHAPATAPMTTETTKPLNAPIGSNLFSILDGRNVTKQRNPLLYQQQPTPPKSSPTKATKPAPSIVPPTTNSPTTNFELLWNQVMKSHKSSSGFEQVLRSDSTDKTSSQIAQRRKQLRHTRQRR